MNKSKQFYNFLRTKMKEQRQMFLEQTGTTEWQIKKCWRCSDKYRNREYFILDGYRIWMPEYFQYVQQYKKYLFSKPYPQDIIFE